MGQEEVVPAPATVVFSWEYEPGLSKQIPLTEKPVSTPAMEARDIRERSRKAPARRLSVPPPPGRSSMPATRSFPWAQAVRPEDDPFLAAYLACTKSSGDGGGRKGGKSGRTAPAREPKGQRRFTWAGLGLSCKSSNGAVKESMVKLAKLPEVDPRDT